MKPIRDIPGKLQRIEHPFGGWGDDYNGACRIKLSKKQVLTVLFSIGEEWEHVSVSKPLEYPTWDEMCEVRAIFWPDDQWVIQYHPPKKDYSSVFIFCLHLWRPISGKMPTPQPWQLGPRYHETH